MSSVNEQEKLASIRKDIAIQADETRKTIEAIKELFAKNGANEMHNVSIMFNNKLSEILHEYYKVDLELFDGGFLDGVVFNYILDAYTECVNILDEIMRYLRVRRIFYPSNDPNVIKMIKRYVAISEGLYDFNLKEDLDKAIFEYSMSKAQMGYIIDKDKAMEDMKPDLDKLGIDAESLKDSFFIPKDFIKGFIKVLRVTPKKDINE